MKREDFVEITKKHIEVCKEFINKKTICYISVCVNCPFSFANAKNSKGCVINGYAENENFLLKDEKLIESSKKFIKLFEGELK